MNPDLDRRMAALRERLVQSAGFRTAFLGWSWAKAACHRSAGNEFAAADATLRYSRILSAARPDATPPQFINRRNQVVIRQCVNGGDTNPLLKSYVRSAEADQFRREFRRYGTQYARALKYPKALERPDREGDLLLLKPWISPKERGVVLVQYNDALRKFAALYDLPRLASRYRFVLEPSTWGYQEATFLMFLGLKTDVFVEAQYDADFRYIRELGHNMHPLPLGAGDWVDPAMFGSDAAVEKHYDAIMVASWLALKRHDLFFQALRPLISQVGRVALVGYPSGGRTQADIRREASRHGVLHIVDIYESVPPARVSELLQQSKVSLMLTRREGASRAIYESFFSNTPVIVSACNIGINREHIHKSTGMFSDDANLSHDLLHMIQHSATFSPRAWALRHTGFCNSTRRLNADIRAIAVASGEEWTTDIYAKKNCPNAMYADDEERRHAREHFSQLDEFLRSE